MYNIHRDRNYKRTMLYQSGSSQYGATKHRNQLDAGTGSCSCPQTSRFHSSVHQKAPLVSQTDLQQINASVVERELSVCPYTHRPSSCVKRGLEAPCTPAGESTRWEEADVQRGVQPSSRKTALPGLRAILVHSLSFWALLHCCLWVPWDTLLFS